MERIEQKKSKSHIVIIPIIGGFFSSFTLWLIESPIKYPLFVIETLTIIAIYVILRNYEWEFIPKLKIAKPAIIGIILDLLLVFSSSVLLVWSQFNLGDNIIRLFLSFFTISALSGFAILNIWGISKYFSRLENLVLSSITSFVVSGLLVLLFLGVAESSRSFAISSIFIVLGILSLFKHMKNNDEQTGTPNSFCRNLDGLVLILCTAFYAISFYNLYPNLTGIAGDVSRHFQESLVLSRAPDLYTGFSYLLFHSFESVLYSLSGSPSIASFLTIQVLFCFLLPISIYIFSKRFLADIDKRIPAISAIFYTILSNFSFFYFTKLKLLGTSDTEVGLLLKVANRAYNGTLYFAQPWMWFVPVTISFIIFIFVFILLKAQNISRLKLIPLFVTLIFGMYLIHVTEAVIFVLILAGYSLISKSKVLRLDDALFSSIIAFIIAIPILLYTELFWPSFLRELSLDKASIFAIIIPILVSLFALVWRNKILYRIHYPFKSVPRKKHYQILTAILITVYIAGTLTWFFDDNLNTLFNASGVVPWFIYPLTLGIVGFVAILVIKYLNDILPNSSVSILLGTIVILLIFGSVLSIVNNFFYTGYYEKRFPPFIFLIACLLAPIPIVKISGGIDVKRKISREVGFSAIISIIIVLGFSSSVLTVEYWTRTAASQTISHEELQAITSLRNILQHDSHAFMFAPSGYSSDLLSLASSPYNLPNPIVLTNANDPGSALYQQSAHNLPHMYIYMDKRDLSIPKGAWFSHLLNTSPVVFSNKEVTIYNATHISFPRQSSSTSLLVPIDNVILSKSLYFAYDLVSKNDKNYTVMFDKDKNALNAKTVVLSYDPVENSTISPSDYISFANSGGHLVVVNTNGYGSISRVLFNLGNSPFNTSTITISPNFSILINSKVLPITPAHDVKTLGVYVSQDNKTSVFLAEKNVGLGKITYVNMYPVITGFNKQNAEVYQKLVEKIAPLIGSDKLVPEPHKIFSNFSYRQMIGTGNVTIETRSLVFPIEKIAHMTVQSNGGQVSISNITKFKINNYKDAILYTNQTSLQDGKGLYGNLVTGNSLTASFTNATLDVLSNTLGPKHFENVSKIIFNSSVQVYIWQPKVSIDGSTSFSEFSGPAGIANTLPSYTLVTISGNVSFDMFMSDTYTLGNNIISKPLK